MKLRTGIDTAYALELHFEKDSFHRNGDGTIRHYRNKWASYEKNIITPQTLAQVETLAPGSTHELNHPLWAVMSLFENKKPIEADKCFKGLSIDILSVLYAPEHSGFSIYSARMPVTQTLLDKLEHRASLDSLTALIILMLETGGQNPPKLTVEIALAIHNILSMIAIELEARRIAARLLKWVISNILPLGTLPHLRVWMTNDDYVHASAHLNLMVYHNKQRHGKRLAWTQRVKVMEQLIHGRMGFDVQHAMRPQFDLRDDIGEIHPELVKTFEYELRLRTWGWDCILNGEKQPFPPASVLTNSPS